jgi:predicted transcriptional regulator
MVQDLQILFTAEGLKRFRKELSLTNNEFATTSGISEVTISKLQNGRIKFSSYIKKALQAVFLKEKYSGYFPEKYDELIGLQLKSLNQKSKVEVYEVINKMLSNHTNTIAYK